MVKQKNETDVKKEKIVFAVGKRKKAVARARIRSGSGRILINNSPLDMWEPEFSRLKIRESLMIIDSPMDNIDIKVNVHGGGVSGQTDAARQAIARALVEYYKDEKLKKKLLEYDRNLLVYDYRRTEPHKPSRSRQGARRHKQRSKR